MGLRPSKRTSKPRLTLWANQFDAENVAPTITITKAAIGTNLEIGIEADAAGPLVNNTIAADLAGITGVQAPAVKSAASALQMLKVTTLNLMAWNMTFALQLAISKFLEIPQHVSRTKGVRSRVLWATASTTTSKIVRPEIAVKTFGDSETLDVSGANILTPPADNPSGTANQLMVGPWTSEQLNWAAEGDEGLYLRVRSGGLSDVDFYLLALQLEFYST